MGLQQYWNKRNFTVTPEPHGASQSSSGRLQFVIQQHAASHLHYDFRLEIAGTFKSDARRRRCIDFMCKNLPLKKS